MEYIQVHRVATHKPMQRKYKRRQKDSKITNWVQRHIFSQGPDENPSSNAYLESNGHPESNEDQNNKDDPDSQQVPTLKEVPDFEDSLALQVFSATLPEVPVSGHQPQSDFPQKTSSAVVVKRKSGEDVYPIFKRNTSNRDTSPKLRIETRLFNDDDGKSEDDENGENDAQDDSINEYESHGNSSLGQDRQPLAHIDPNIHSNSTSQMKSMVDADEYHLQKFMVLERGRLIKRTKIAATDIAGSATGTTDAFTEGTAMDTTTTGATATRNTIRGTIGTSMGTAMARQSQNKPRAPTRPTPCLKLAWDVDDEE